MDEAESKQSHQTGTLAIDLGNCTTVVLFQGERDIKPILIDIPPITRSRGEVPSLIWTSSKTEKDSLVGQQVIKFGLSDSNDPSLSTDFKRWIANKYQPKEWNSNLSPEEAGQLLLTRIWDNLPSNITVKRLVISAPVESYRGYRAWLYKVCSNFPVEEIALVDESTAAALGAGLASGSNLLVVDIGGSTIDLSIVKLEGGEGKAEPIAQLMRFRGQDLEGSSNQILRCASVLGKAGISLGGRDFDRWLAHYFFPESTPKHSLLNACERLKCRLSEENINPEDILKEEFYTSSEEFSQSIELSKSVLESILIDNGFLNVLSNLLKETLTKASLKGCKLENLTGVVLVGGGARIPLVKRWFKENILTVPLLTPPPIEAVAKGALSLTPGVTIRDLLQRGVCLRCWDKKSEKHIWHPIFLPGQPWPTTKPFELILASSIKNQPKLELVMGEPNSNQLHEVIYENGIPAIKEVVTKRTINPWPEAPISIELSPSGEEGKDCLKLQFSLNNKCQLMVSGIDLRSGQEIRPQTLGFIK